MSYRFPSRLKQVTARKNQRIRQLTQSQKYLRKQVSDLRTTVKILQAL